MPVPPPPSPAVSPGPAPVGPPRGLLSALPGPAVAGGEGAASPRRLLGEFSGISHYLGDFSVISRVALNTVVLRRAGGRTGARGGSLWLRGKGEEREEKGASEFCLRVMGSEPD